MQDKKESFRITYNIVNYGTRGNGYFLNTEKIQNTIDIVHQTGGGKVRLSVSDGDSISVDTADVIINNLNPILDLGYYIYTNEDFSKMILEKPREHDNMKIIRRTR